ncbi:TPA: hypothetical protein ACGCAV_003715, partial [Acinetobacter nosocomialis]
MLSKLLNSKKQSFSQINLLKFIPYALTFLYLSYIFYICFLADPNGYSWGNVGIKLQSIDFGGFGSFLAGIFSPLAFLWLFLTFKQTDKNLQIAQKQLMILEEKEENRKKLIKPIFSNIKSRVYPLLPVYWYTYTIDISIIGEVNRIFPIIKSDPDTFKIEKTVRSIMDRSSSIDGFPFYQSFKDEELTFRFQISFSQLRGNEIFEIELHYLDKDGNDQLTIIY